MIDQKQHKEIMPQKSVASLKWIQSKAFTPNPQGSRTSVDGSDVKDEFNAQTRGGALKHNSSLGSDFYAPPYESYQGPIYQQGICMFSTIIPDFQRLQLNQLNVFDSQMYPNYYNYSFPVENQFHYVPFGSFYQGYPSAILSQEFFTNQKEKILSQEFQYFVVIDFEATCEKERNPHPQEIIEFPSVIVNSMTGKIECAFQVYVRPSYHQHLSDFCKELTGIEQSQVDSGVSLTEALDSHDRWLEDKGIKHTKFAVVTWSNWDCEVMLENECRFKKIKKPTYFNRWINLKVPFHEVFSGVRCNLKEAVQKAGLAWEGRAHCGLDDAKNTARLLSYLMRQGFRFSITNSLMCHSTDQSLSLHQSLDCSLKPAHSPYQLKHPSVSLPQYLPAYVESGKVRQSSVPTTIKVAKTQPKSQGHNNKESSSVVATGLPRQVAYVLASKGILVEPVKTGNPF